MADPFPPSEARERRIGAWISGAAHAALIGWVAVGGALFRPPQAPALRMSPVATMSAAQFESMAAAARGSGPIGAEAAVTPAQPRPPSAEVIAGGPVAMAPPAPDADPQALPAPEFAGEAAPNLSDLQVPQTPVAVATVAPMPQQPPQAQDEALPSDAAGVDLPPDLPKVAAAPPLSSPSAEAAAPAALPPPPVLMTSEAPFEVAAARQRRAERIAAAAAEAARAEAEAEAEARAQAQAAEAARQEAARQEAARQAEAERQAQEALETERRAAEQARIAAEAAAREQAQRAAAEAAAAEAARAQAEAQAAAEAERQAALEAEQQEQERREAEARERAEAEARRAEQQRLAEEAQRAEEARRLAEQREAEEARRRAEEEAAAAEAARALARAEEEAALARAEAQAREQAEAARQAPEDADPLMAALNEALDLPGAVEEDGGGRAALGPPLSRGEKDGLRLQIEACWNIGSLSREAQRTAVSVQFSMSADGMPDADSVRMIAFDGGSDAAAAQAFEAARRAILRCALQGDGYNLPAEKYGRWRDTIIDFRPQGGPSIR